MCSDIVHYQYFLKQGLWLSSPADGASSELDLPTFLLSRQQATSGVVSRFSEREEFQNEVTILKLQRQSHVEALKAVKARLDSAGVPFVLLKGLGCDYYYPEQGLRDLGDIDLFVREENYGQAALAFGLKTTRLDSPKHFRTEVEGITIEVHRHCEIMPSRKADRQFRRLADEGLLANPATLSIDGITVNVPSDNFNAIYLFTHFFNHFLGGGCGLRQVCDWMLFLHARSDSLDREYIITALKSLGLTNAWRIFGAMAVCYLGMPAEEMPLYDRRLRRRGGKLLHVMLDMGNFGSSRKQERKRRFGASFFGRKLGSFLGAVGHSAEMLTLFPVHSVRGFAHTLTGSTAKTFRQIRGGDRRSSRGLTP